MHSIQRVFLPLIVAMLFFGCQNEGAETPQSDSKPAVVDKHFELLSKASSGINFSNTITETFENNILINSYLYNGGGVAVLDINNDNLPDLYFSATQEPNRLYLNKGDFVFEDITESAGVGANGGTKTGITAVDINADGFMDLYVCKSGMEPTQERANLLYINNGDLTFTEMGAEYGLDDRSASNHANFFDYDLDGDLDAYILNHPVAFKEVNRISARQEGDEIVRNTEPLDEWESDKLFRNDNGRFVDVSKDAGINNRAWGLSVTVSYFNDDFYPDIFIGNDYIEPDLLYINNGDGTFSIETDKYFRHMSNHTMGVDIADFNNDERIDVVALDMIAEDNQRQKELMTTMVLDRYTSLVKYNYGHQVMRNVLQVNTGAEPKEGASFSDIGVLSGVWNTDWSWSPLLCDFNNDGFKDLYVTNGYRRDISNLDYLTYTVDSVMRLGGLTTTNFTTIDEYLNLIPSTPLKNYMFKNTDGLNFENVSDSWGLGQTSYSNGSAYGDLDADGDMDLIVNQISQDVLLYKNLSVDEQKGNYLQIQLKGSPRNPSGTGARVRISYGDGQFQYQELTPTRGFFSSSEHLLHFGLANVNTINKIEIQWLPDGRIQELSDVAVNQRMVLKYDDGTPGEWKKPEPPQQMFEYAENTGIDFRHVEDNFIDFDRERMIPHKFSNLGPSIGVADVNGDGLEDFYIGGARNQPGALFVQQSNSTFKKDESSTWTNDARYEDMGCIFFDADGDSDLDLYVVSGGSTDNIRSLNYQDRLYLNDGSGGFTSATETALPDIVASGSCVAAHDYDSDGDLDLFVGGLVSPGLYPKAPMTCLLQNDGGKFSDVCASDAPELNEIGMVSDLVWTDLSGDGNEELVVVGEWLAVTVFDNNNGKLEEATSKYGLQDTEGWWTCTRSGDLDNDGDNDLVVGNLGLNSRLKASKQEPLRLFVKDFDNNGAVDPVLAYYNGGLLYPLPTRDQIIKQIPILKKKFVRYTDYGKATMDEVFTKNALEQADQYEAKTFATTWFENDNGKMIPHELPLEVQFAPCNGILIEDINGDGNPDLLMAGNSSRPDVETGRYDAGNGELLLGDGKGVFTPVPNLESGFWATKEARDLEAVRLANGKTLYLVANNNDALQGFVR